MSWMTPPVWSDTGGSSREDLFKPVPVLFHADQAETEVGDGVARDVVDLVAADLDQDQCAVDLDPRAGQVQRRGEPVATSKVTDLDRQHAGLTGERGLRLRPQQPAAVQHDDVVADVFELAQQV